MSGEIAQYETGQEVAQQAIRLQANTHVINPMALIQMAVERDAPIEKLQQLLDLRDRYEAGEAKKAFDSAMAKFKAECPSIKKNHQVDFTSQKGRTTYMHATLDNICGTINPVLGEYGLSYCWNTKQDGGLVSVTCHLAHALGHKTDGVTLASGLDTSGNKNSIQSIGSTVTYLQRYTLLAALGLSTELDDDDGQESGGSPGAQDVPAPVEFYPDAQFKAMLPKWREAMAAGKKDAEGIIAMVETKSPLTDRQKTIIRTGE